MLKGVLIALVGLVGVTTATFSCSENVLCQTDQPLKYNDHTRCTAEWGAFPRINTETNKLVLQQFQASFEYLLIASHFKDWKNHRPGFATYFSKLSDSNWDEALSLLTHMIERGGTLVEDFRVDMPGPGDANTHFQLKEIEALTKALDTERKTATKTLHLAHLANHGQGVPHDSEFAEFLAERLHHNSVLRIKHLANYVKLLADIVQDTAVDSAYALFKFDSEYLK